MKIKFTLNDVFIIFYSFLIFNIAFTSIFPKTIVNIMTIITFGITILLAVGTIKIILSKINGTPFFLFLCYLLLTTFSTSINKGSLFATGIVSSTINYVMILITIFFGVLVISSFGKLKLFLISLYLFCA